VPVGGGVEEVIVLSEGEGGQLVEECLAEGPGMAVEKARRVLLGRMAARIFLQSVYDINAFLSNGGVDHPPGSFVPAVVPQIQLQEELAGERPVGPRAPGWSKVVKQSRSHLT
jgi:hypothetical protein